LVIVSRNGTCRIIGGNWRGRKIKFDDAEGLRPTTDRIRETVFNWLQPYLYNSVCLDLFAGSGVLGFEAKSRGAAEVVFIESNKQTADNIQNNTVLLKTSNVVVHHADAFKWLLDSSVHGPFNLIFLDPPFQSDLLEKCGQALTSSGILMNDAIIYVEYEKGANFEVPENWSCIKSKCAGQVNYQLFELI